ncbi:L,D-transpeptidase catalytic domain [Variibacter gotjawalensis]|uniref:L,D-transpeptidase catalytic domain n=1 Tax=Variibacter gotjawalensis TaxID=1333996 RepID=A0A0S3PQK5_9BRAD|nr:L,D-transpeptidase family protein [Variibacter gotjawalensis]RZS50380.1 L,D-peptidoglycan transpeptidase YkuD (ErfK/YbiS/YcfS/YnhG family) [Variibacter gotjawalensis]BAT58215.1 L,D-transpeptidase catalytic domain [Variibacter gotjawalensis]
MQHDSGHEGVRCAGLVQIRARAGARSKGWLKLDGRSIPVSLGRGGILADKREGDGGTPRGVFLPVRVWWRKDRGSRPQTLLPTRPIRPDDAWCEDPKDRRYNQPIRLGPGAAGDRLTRDDHLYDIIIEIDHNTHPRVAGRGSAVFIHLARKDFSPTAGCVGLTGAELRRLLGRMSKRTRIEIR